MIYLNFYKECLSWPGLGLIMYLSLELTDMHLPKQNNAFQEL